MTPSEIAAVRRKTGMTQDQFARFLRLGPQGARSVRRWENGETALPGPASIVYDLLQNGTVPVDGTTLRLAVLHGP